MSYLQARNSELMERYLRDGLPEGELEDLETHVLECDDCADELERLATLSSELAERREEIEAAQVPDRLSSWRLWLRLAAVLLVVLGVVLYLQPWAKNDLALLVSIEPPHYQKSQIRGAVDDAGTLFVAAMERYKAADYEGAILDLESAAALDPERTEIRFFLGASKLLIGKVEKGVEALDRVISQGDTPYLEEALYLRVQGHLLRGDSDAAASDLRSILELEGDWEDRAKSQLEQLEAWSQQER